jgi:Stress responsive A/B Barrel Domain
MAARPGFEPGQGESKSPVLPLHHQAVGGREIAPKRRSVKARDGAPSPTLQVLPLWGTADEKQRMLIHSVFFWLKSDLTEAQRAAFRAGLESLRGVKSIEAVYIGSPAPIPPRPVVDASYSFSLTILFKDVAAHDAYQVDPLHKAFLDNCRTFWTKVQIYDAA